MTSNPDRKAVLIDLARRQIGLLHAEIKFKSSHQRFRPDDLANSNQKLIKVARQSRLALLQLSTSIESLGGDAEQCPEVQFLIGLIHEATLMSSELYESIFSEAKRRSLNAFEKSVLQTFQQGKGPQYMSTISKEEILNQGHEVNRLYQLLIEGKTADFRADAATLKSAAARDDLFSDKQCHQLSKRSIEIEKWMLEETDRLVSESNELEDFGQLNAEIRKVACIPASAGWSCVQCTYYNEQSSAVNCQGCGFPQYEDFVTVAKRKPKQNQISATPKVDGEKPQASAIPTKQQCKDDAIELYIENNAVPNFIGPNGRNVQALIRKTGAKSIFANQKRLDEFNWCPIEISGSSVAVEKARTLIEETYSAKLRERKIVWIANVDVPEFIGPCGRDVQALKKQSGIQFARADQDNVIDDLCPIRIEGCPLSAAIAVDLVVQRFGGSVDSPPSPRKESNILKPEPIINASKTPVQEEQASSHCDSVIDEKTIVAAASTKPSPCLHSTAGVVSKSDEVSIQPQDDIMAPGPYPVALEQQSISDAKLLPASVQSGDISPADALAVLQTHKNALKSAVSISSFHQWLQSVDIESLEDILEALTDDDVFEDMKRHGFKAFKRNAVIRDVTDRLEAVQRSSFSTSYSTEKVAANSVLPNPQPPAELLCPITHALFRDPVIAADNQTYERVEIEAWFRQALSQGIETPLSPLTGEPMEHLNLSSNILIAQLARDFTNNHPGYDF